MNNNAQEQTSVVKLLACLLAVVAMVVAIKAQASKPDAEAKHQSYESCSMIASEYLTIVQLHQRGFTRAQLQKNLPDITQQGKKDIDDLYRAIAKNGVTSTYSTINARYAKCAKEVYDLHGKPATGTRPYRFYFCAGENKLRYQILIAAYLGGTPKEILPQVPESRQKVAKALFNSLKEKGVDKTFDGLASELKRCINGV